MRDEGFAHLALHALMQCLSCSSLLEILLKRNEGNVRQIIYCDKRDIFFLSKLRVNVNVLQSGVLGGEPTSGVSWCYYYGYDLMAGEAISHKY